MLKLARTSVALLLLLGLAISVFAQGQTPTAPRPRPDNDAPAPSPEPVAEPKADPQVAPKAEPKAPARPPGPQVVDQGTRPPLDVPAVTTGAERVPGVTTPAMPGISGVAAEPFDPAYLRPVEYPDLPDVGEDIRIEGPVPLPEFLALINLATDWNMFMSPAVEETQLGFFIMDQVRPREAMKLLRLYRLHYEYDEATNFLFVRTQREWLAERYGELASREFHVGHASPDYVQAMLETVSSPAGRIITDQRTGRIYVWDTQDNLDQMTKMVTDLDVPLQKAELNIRYAELADMQVILGALLTANGRMAMDIRTSQIFVWDTPAALSQIRAAVDRLDVPVEARTILIRHINAENLIDNLEVHRSDRGIIQIDPRSNALVITDLPQRVEKMAALVEALDVPLETRTWVINYADLDFVAEQVANLIPVDMGEVIVHDAVHQLTVTGLQGRLEEIDALIKTWDVPKRQVHIQAYIVEVGTEVERNFNINWSYFGSAGSRPLVLHSGDGAQGIAEAAGSGEVLSFGQLPYAVPMYGALELGPDGNIRRPLLTNIDGETMIDRFAGNRLAMTLDYLDRQEKATILSSPRITVNDGEEAVFENATRVPYVSATTLFGQQTGQPTFPGFHNTSRVEFIDVGTILTVFPRITEDNNILLDIDAEDSTFVFRQVLTQNTVSTVPEKTVRRAQTQLRVGSGETVVLGGLRRDRAATSVTKTPLLGDLPLVGRLFRNPSRESRNNSLLLFITTTVVDDRTTPEAVALARAEEDLHRHSRFDRKDLWGRIADNLASGKNEIGVSIGQSGDMHSEGGRVTLDELRAIFSQVGAPGTVNVVVRRHPLAPSEVIAAVTEAAIEAGLRVEFDDSLTPLVPHYSGIGTGTGAGLAEPLVPVDGSLIR